MSWVAYTRTSRTRRPRVRQNWVGYASLGVARPPPNRDTIRLIDAAGAWKRGRFICVPLTFHSRIGYTTNGFGAGPLTTVVRNKRPVSRYRVETASSRPPNGLPASRRGEWRLGVESESRATG